jgi:hypothetical protein
MTTATPFCCLHEAYRSARRPFKVVAVALANKWRGWIGPCWPRAVPIGRLRLWQRRKEAGDETMRLRPCVHELQE